MVVEVVVAVMVIMVVEVMVGCWVMAVTGNGLCGRWRRRFGEGGGREQPGPAGMYFNSSVFDVVQVRLQQHKVRCGLVDPQITVVSDRMKEKEKKEHI